MHQTPSMVHSPMGLLYINTLTRENSLFQGESILRIQWLDINPVTCENSSILMIHTFS